MRSEKYYESARDDLIQFVPDNAKRILDIGCGAGMMGLALKKKLGSTIEVYGIEINPKAGDKAKANIDKVFIGDAENIALPFKNKYLDCIICADVLEHLIDPWGFILKQTAYLKDGGLVIASIPNISHYRIIKMLKKGEWNYENAGILDRTHLRFFTLKSIASMFKDAHLEIVKIERKIGASNSKKLLNRFMFNSLSDIITEQYIIIAKKR